MVESKFETKPDGAAFVMPAFASADSRLRRAGIAWRQAEVCLLGDMSTTAPTYVHLSTGDVRPNTGIANQNIVPGLNAWSPPI